MRTSYLAYLADLGATNIHPLGQAATECLVSALDPRPGERLLEIGCGTGETMVRLALQEDVTVDGIDVLWSMLRVARRRLDVTGATSRTGLTLASGCALPWAGGSYDAVYTESVLGFQDVGSARAMLREIRRVLRPRGRYVANEAIWREGTDAGTVAAIYLAGLADFGLSQASPQPWSVDVWAREMKDAGFHLDAADLLTDRVAALIARRGRGVGGGQRWRSALLSAFYRLHGFLSPRLLHLTWHYRQRLARHWEDGRHMESRLLVLTARC
jgi:SAM-dependent methyltransferase